MKRTTITFKNPGKETMHQLVWQFFSISCVPKVEQGQTSQLSTHGHAQEIKRWNNLPYNPYFFEGSHFIFSINLFPKFRHISFIFFALT